MLWFTGRWQRPLNTYRRPWPEHGSLWHWTFTGTQLNNSQSCFQGFSLGGRVSWGFLHLLWGAVKRSPESRTREQLLKVCSSLSLSLFLFRSLGVTSAPCCLPSVDCYRERKWNQGHKFQILLPRKWSTELNECVPSECLNDPGSGWVLRPRFVTFSVSFICVYYFIFIYFSSSHIEQSSLRPTGQTLTYRYSIWSRESNANNSISLVLSQSHDDNNWYWNLTPAHTEVLRSTRPPLPTLVWAAPYWKSFPMIPTLIFKMCSLEPWLQCFIIFSLKKNKKTNKKTLDSSYTTGGSPSTTSDTCNTVWEPVVYCKDAEILKRKYKWRTRVPKVKAEI